MIPVMLIKQHFPRSSPLVAGRDPNDCPTKTSYVHRIKSIWNLGCRLFSSGRSSARRRPWLKASRLGTSLTRLRSRSRRCRSSSRRCVRRRRPRHRQARPRRQPSASTSTAAPAADTNGRGGFRGRDRETVDPIVAKIRDEGLNHSQVMPTLDYLTNVIGQRLTGSTNAKRANDWTRGKLEGWGLANAHLESWGPFGRGWIAEAILAASDQTADDSAHRLPEGMDARLRQATRGRRGLARRQDRRRSRRSTRASLRGRSCWPGRSGRLIHISTPQACG